MLCNRVVVAVVVVVAIAARPTYYHRGSLEGSFTHFCIEQKTVVFPQR